MTYQAAQLFYKIYFKMDELLYMLENISITTSYIFES